MAFSPSEPRQLAFIARESGKAPAPVNELDPKRRQQLINEVKEHGLRDTLYVVNSDGGSPPKAITTFQENVSVGAIIYEMSLCWTADSNALLCFYGESIFRVSLDGKKRMVYKMGGNDDHMVGPLTARPDGLTSFVNYYKSRDVSRTPELVSIDSSGAIKHRQTLVSYVPVFGEEAYNFVAIGQDKWAYCTKMPDVKTNRFWLYVAPLSYPAKQTIYEINCDVDFPCFLRLYAFAPDEQELLVGRKITMSTSIISSMLESIRSKKPAVPFSQLCKIKL
jgi:hypothetical protein